MADIAIFRINYKSDFILTLNSDAGWLTPFCIKFWTGAPSQAYFVGYDGTTYTHCAPVDGDPTKLSVQFDDHHLPIGDLKFQIGYHFTVADFPTSIEDEVINQEAVIIDNDGEQQQVMLDFNGETAPEIAFAMPAYANEAQRIDNEQARIAAEEQRVSNEQQRISNEEGRISAEESRQEHEQQRIHNEETRIAEFASLKADAIEATGAANDAATLANEKAQLAADKAALAQAAATLANDKAQLAADKAALAQAAATLANDKAALAQQKADYAQAQGDYAKAQGDIALADHERAETDHERAEADHDTATDDHTTATSDHTQAKSDHARAESDHTTAASDHTQASSDHDRAESDHTKAGQDHDRAESDHTTAAADHTRAESDHAAVEAYVDSLGAFDISAYHATSNVLAKYADLTAALGTNGANVPDALRKGGMSVKFVLSSDNKYVKFFCTADEFTTDVIKWQGVDDEPTAGSSNLVKSGSVFEKVFPFTQMAQESSVYGKYLDTNGVEKGGGSAYVVTYNIEPDKEYYISSQLRKQNSIWWTTIGIFETVEGEDKQIKQIKNADITSGARYSYKISTDGISNVTKLKVVTSSPDTTYLNILCESYNNIKELVKTVSISSIDYDKVVRTSGAITDLSGARIYNYAVSTDRKYVIQAIPSSYTSAFVFISLYKDTTLVKIIKTFNGANYPNTKYIVDTGSLDVNILKIVTNSVSPIVIEYDYNTVPLQDIPLSAISPDAIYSTNGYYNVITEDSEDANSAINYSDGSIATSDQYMKSGVVRHYTLPDNVVVKIHLITPIFSSAYIAGCVMKNGVVVKKYLRLDGTNKTVDFVIDNRTLKADTLLLSINKNSKDYTIVTHTAEILEPTAEDLPSASTLVEMPTKIYTLEQTAMKFGVIQRLYIEGIANSSNKTLKIDGAQNVIINYGKQYTSHNQTYVQYINISADGYSDYFTGVSVRETEPTKLNNQRPKILCIGDSLTDNGYPALVEFIAKSLNQDYNNTIGVTMVGTRLENRDISLGEYSFQGCRGANEGRSGWAICTYLRHINVVTANKTQWDLLGLGTMTRNGVPSRSYVSFDSTNQEHLALLSSTCHGWYDVENTEEVFNYITNGDIYHVRTFEYEGETYTLGDSYSSDQYPVMVKAFKYILTSGERWKPNPFYSYDTVQASNGEYAFNFSEYINKYKTLDVDGVTRLVAGSTAGSFVTNVTDYDVCVPSHVVIIMSENYQRYGSNITAADIVDDFESIADLIYQYDSSVKIAFGCTRKYGAFNPSMYDFYPGVFGFSSHLYNIWRETKTRFNNSNYYIIPLYATQSILGSGGGRSFDSLDQKERCNMIGDYTHAGNVVEYLDRAIDVISWVASTY